MNFSACTRVRKFVISLLMLMARVIRMAVSFSNREVLVACHAGFDCAEILVWFVR